MNESSRPARRVLLHLRAGRLRASVIASGHEPKLADTLIAQSCLDHEVQLVTRDDDFRHFVDAGLQLVPGQAAS